MPINKDGLYVSEDIAFINTAEISKTGRDFIKQGKYTLAPKGSSEYNEFWDIEDKRINEGITVPGKLFVDKFGNTKIQEVKITGEHYAYLNYGMIKKLNRKDLENVVKLSSRETQSGKIRAFPDFWDGDFHYYTAKEVARKERLHIAVSKARRKGFTYKEGFDGALGANMNPDTITLVGAFDYKYITQEGQIMDFIQKYLDFFELHTDFNRGYLNRTEKKVKLGYVEEKDSIEKGYLSTILALSFMDNYNAAIGKDAFRIKLEECGNFPNLLDVLNVTLPTLKDGNVVTGLMTLFGATTKNVKDWEGFEEVFFNPKKYDCLAFDNVWDFETQGTPCGFFFPYKQNLVSETKSTDKNLGFNQNLTIDVHGNSLVEGSLKLVEEEDAVHKKEDSPEDYLVWKAQYANCPKDAFFGSTGGRFASIELLSHLKDVRQNFFYNDLGKKGFLEDTGKKIQFVFEKADGTPAIAINEYPLKDKLHTDGCIVEWFSPYRNAQGIIPDDLYLAITDPFATDKEKGTITAKNSLGSTFIYERANNFTKTKGDILVAAYHGRPLHTEEYSSNLFKLCRRWNAKLQYESDRGTILQDAKLLKAIELLLEEPTLDYDKKLGGQTGRTFGIHMNSQRIESAVLYLYQWLHTKRSIDENGKVKLNLHYIYDKGLLEELVKWNSKGNFDRVSALLILMLQIKEFVYKEVEIRNNIYNKDDFFDNMDLFN